MHDGLISDRELICLPVFQYRKMGSFLFNSSRAAFDIDAAIPRNVF
jgi:hypothetical protein